MINVINSLPLKIGNSMWRKAVLKEHLRIINLGNSPQTSLGVTGISSVKTLNIGREQLEELQFLVSKDLSCYLELSKNAPLKNAFTFKLSTPCLNALISSIKSTHIAREVVAALGNYDVVFHSPCGLYAKTINEVRLDEIDGSGFWHRDSIGSAIKIFICLENTEDGVTTELIRESHFMDPFVREWEMGRACSSPHELNMLEQAISSAYTAKIIRTSLKAGQYFAFNTNAVHRGCYIQNSPGSRLTAQITLTTKANVHLYDAFHGTDYHADLKYVDILT